MQTAAEKINTSESVSTKNANLLIPKRVTIETIFGCNAKCVMCPIDYPTKRKKGIMPLGMFENIIDTLTPYRKQVEMMDLFGLGEPLLDPHIFKRIGYIKEKGFDNTSLGISTNADLLSLKKQQLLLASGIDNIIFSIDGVKKETHESIRRGVKFERVLGNCLSIIKMRDEGNYKARFVIRFIRQDVNRKEWGAFKQFWQAKISKERGDFITAYDAHSWGGEVSTKDSVLGTNRRIESVEKQPCNIIFDILYVLCDGAVPLCHEDWLNTAYAFGNVAETLPVEIFNCDAFNKIREIHQAGDKNKINMCRECTNLYSEITKESV